MTTPPKIVGILNLTPDSFSGDGRYGQSVSQLLTQIDAMIEAGADVIDVGAESTRPNAAALSDNEEWERLHPLLDALGERTNKTLFSLDTYHPQNAKRALDKGFHWINDVSGGSVAMVEAVLPYSAMLVLMHSLSIPADKAITLPADVNPVNEVMIWGEETLKRLSLMRLAKDRIILDPGIGFGKTAQQSLELIKKVDTLKQWEVPVLMGHSRKSFLVPLMQDAHDDRDTATQAVSVFLALRGVDYIRVHDVSTHRTLLAVVKALL